MTRRGRILGWAWVGCCAAAPWLLAVVWTLADRRAHLLDRLVRGLDSLRLRR